MIRYEHLLADRAATLRGLLAWAGLAVDDDAIEATVSRESFQSIPPEERGGGKVFRAAAPGLWRENMTPAEQELVTELHAGH